MLTAKQEEFAKKIAEGMTYSDAYRSAYDTKRMSDKTVNEKASLLKDEDKIRARVKELRDMSAKDTIMTAQKRKEWLTEVINDPNVDINAKLKATDLLNKMDGEYVQKIAAEVQTETTINIELVDDE